MSLPQAITFVLEREGSAFTNDPNDPGGPTRYGVALNRHPELTLADIQNMTAERAGSIFEAQYWPPRAAELPDYLATPLLAASVLQGQRTAVQELQAALGTHADGAIGDQTIGAAKNADQKSLLARFAGEQVRRLRQDSAWAADGIGWIERLTAAVLEA